MNVLKCRRTKRDSEGVTSYIIIGFLVCLSAIPLLVAISSSLSDEEAILVNGYSILPQNFTVDTYKFMLSNKGSMLLRAYGTTIATTVFGTIYTMVVTTCFAYATAQKQSVFPLRDGLSFFAWFASVFNAGVLPWYILCSQYYGLYNNLWALFIPYGMNVFNMFVLRNNFRALPEEIIEAARIDGASNGQIFIRIAIPIAKSGIVTIVLFTVLTYWNDFTLPLYLTTQTKYYTIQRFLYNLMSNLTALLSGMDKATVHMTLPTNTAKMAMTVMTVVPIALVFPFAQKYFVKGLTVGAVKG